MDKTVDPWVAKPQHPWIGVNLQYLITAIIYKKTHTRQYPIAIVGEIIRWNGNKNDGIYLELSASIQQVTYYAHVSSECGSFSAAQLQRILLLEEYVPFIIYPRTQIWLRSFCVALYSVIWRNYIVNLNLVQ